MWQKWIIHKFSFHNFHLLACTFRFSCKIDIDIVIDLDFVIIIIIATVTVTYIATVIDIIIDGVTVIVTVIDIVIDIVTVIVIVTVIDIVTVIVTVIDIVRVIIIVTVIDIVIVTVIDIVIDIVTFIAVSVIVRGFLAPKETPAKSSNYTGSGSRFGKIRFRPREFLTESKNVFWNHNSPEIKCNARNRKADSLTLIVQAFCRISGLSVK